MQSILKRLMKSLKSFVIWFMCVLVLLPLTVGLSILHLTEYMSRICQSLTKMGIQCIETMAKSLSQTATNHRNFWI